MVATIVALAVWAVIMGLGVAGGLVRPEALEREETDPVTWQRWWYVDQQFKPHDGAKHWPTYRIGGEREETSCD